MRAALTIALVPILMAACASTHNQAAQSKLEREISSLSSQVATLSARVATLEANQSSESSGSWILWQRIQTLKSPSNFIATGPAPARPWGAFDSKADCENGAQRIAVAHAAPSGATEYVTQEKDRFGSFTDRIFFTCLPRGVSVNF